MLESVIFIAPIISTRFQRNDREHTCGGVGGLGHGGNLLKELLLVALDRLFIACDIAGSVLLQVLLMEESSSEKGTDRLLTLLLKSSWDSHDCDACPDQRLKHLSCNEAKDLLLVGLNDDQTLEAVEDSMCQLHHDFLSACVDLG